MRCLFTCVTFANGQVASGHSPFQPLNERTNNRRARPNPMLTLLQIPRDRTVAYVPASYLQTLAETMGPIRLAFCRYDLRRALSIVSPRICVRVCGRIHAPSFEKATQQASCSRFLQTSRDATGWNPCERIYETQHKTVARITFCYIGKTKLFPVIKFSFFIAVSFLRFHKKKETYKYT